MAAALPLTKIDLAAVSVADDLAFVAMNDLWTSIAELGHVDDVRLIGGYMVTLHVIRWDLGSDLYRESQDIDLGVPHAIARNPALVESLTAKGYERESGNRYVKAVTDVPVELDAEAPTRYAAIDILLMPATSHARENVRVGDHLTATEVPGLAEALNRAGISVGLELKRLNGEVLTPTVTLADEVSLLLLKALSWHKTGRGTDAIDLWRGLEVAYAAGVGPDAFGHGQRADAARVIHDAFAKRDGLAIERLTKSRGLVRAAGDRIYTRIKALILQVLPPEA